MLTKESVIQAMKMLPAEFTIDDLYSRLDLLYHIDEGLKDIEAGRIVTQENVVKKYAEKWQKLSGQKKR